MIQARNRVQSGFHVSWDQLHRDARALAWRLQGEAPEGGWRAVVAITRGGMAPAMIVSRELGIPCVVSAVGATSRIPDGATIRVNGDTGTVTILDD